MEEPKSYNIIIVPSDHSGTRQFRVSQLLVFVGGGILLTLLAVVVTFAATHLSVLQTARRVGDLQSENVELRQEVARVDELARQIEFLSAQRAQIVNMLGGEELSDGLDLATAEEPFEQQDPFADVERIHALFADGARRAFAPRAWPASGPVRREYLPHAEGDAATHPGLSIEVEAGEAARAAGGGRVVESALSDAQRPTLVLDHGYGFRTVYAGFARPLVSVGQIVEQGQAIGEFDEAGSASRERTGRISVPTLYFEIRVDGVAIDPRNYLTPRQGRRRGS